MFLKAASIHPPLPLRRLGPAQHKPRTSQPPLLFSVLFPCPLCSHKCGCACSVVVRVRACSISLRGAWELRQKVKGRRLLLWVCVPAKECSCTSTWSLARSPICPVEPVCQVKAVGQAEKAFWGCGVVLGSVASSCSPSNLQPSNFNVHLPVSSQPPPSLSSTTNIQHFPTQHLQTRMCSRHIDRPGRNLQS
ncbi:hypothetical protein EJ06DRAFT_373051 [Trichodelitschia bisporula]|uniref:Uncharacterized protein n=1 Tax=Trichodelitschia bisporula TaxID=703511 RepID=A0A6G1I1D0_9PEZI|nr:hypothetical protein EJ06DRAFT_373051 [Trichodelitschia bisporula]